MSNKILVTYATRSGSTIAVAETIQETLKAQGYRVDLKRVDHVFNLDRYEAVIVGSAIRTGAWLPEAVEFVKEHQVVLKSKPTALFAVCMTLQENTPENREIVRHYVDAVCDLIKPVDVGLFAGAMDYRELSFLTEMLSRVMRVPEGDYRNWEAIQEWTKTVTPKLMPEPVR